MNALIVTGGFINDEFTFNYVKKNKYGMKIAVDHGLEFFCRTGLKPDYIVGDFDSIDPSVLELYTDPKEGEEGPMVERLNPMKDDTDTEHALHMALDMGCESIHIFGATGTRLDHVLGNLQLLGFALRKNAECMIIDPHNRIRLINRETILTRTGQFGKYVSLIPYTPQVTGVTLEGFVYPLKEYTMCSFYLPDASPVSGVSNEIAEETARITMKDGILVLVESRD